MSKTLRIQEQFIFQIKKIGPACIGTKVKKIIGNLTKTA